jgi:UDP-N-acetylmuramoyl-tripeptide--D-alanyl-D-alanine ligase
VIGAAQGLWTISELAAVTGGEWLREPGPAWDPRNVRTTALSDIQRAWLPGSIMFVTSEERLQKWFAREAPPRAEPTGCVVVARKDAESPYLPEHRAVLVVDDMLGALRSLAAKARERLQGQVVVVTGSTGKTTTRAMLAEVLRTQGEVLPYTGHGRLRVHAFQQLASAHPETAFVTLELGLSGLAGSLRDVSAVVRPHVVLVTELVTAHADPAGRWSLKRQKAPRPEERLRLEVAESLTEDGVVVLNRDVPAYAELREAVAGRRIVTFGTRADADLRLLGARSDAAGVRVRAQAAGEPFEYELPVPGRFMAMNSLGALAAAAQVGADVAAGAAALAGFVPLRGRARVLPLDVGGVPFTLIDDSHDATPFTMRATLELLEEAEPGPGGRRIAVLGDMADLGDDSAAAHAELAGVAVARGVDRVYTLGTEALHLQRALPPAVAAGHFETHETLVAALADDLCAGDVVTVKGSLGARFERVVQELQGLHDLAPTQPDATPVQLISPGATSALADERPVLRRQTGMPPLGWVLATGEHGGSSLTIGEDVEELPDGVVEGVWDGPFEERRPEAAEHLFGSGVIVGDDGRLTILTPKHTLEAVFLVEHKPTRRTFASNSLALALAAADLRVRKFLSAPSRRIADGFHRFKTRLLDTDEVTIHKLTYFNYELRADGSAVRLPHVEARRFGSYEEYRAAMGDATAALMRNADHPERRRRYEPLATVSGGYDAPACAVLAAEAGCERAATVRVGRQGWNDTGRHIAEALGMTVIERERPDFPETDQRTRLTEPRHRELAAEFVASGAGGDDAVFLAFEDILPGTVLVTGHGGGYWNKDLQPTTDARRRDVSGASLGDYRIRLGFISCPLPFLFVRSQPDVRLIGRSAEMKPWSVGGGYDRPVPRRMIEEAGIPREAFGQQKMAACVVFDGTDGMAQKALSTLADRYARALVPSEPVAPIPSTR